MIERIKDKTIYTFPHQGEPESMHKPQNPYIKFVQSKNIIDILHQIQLVAYHGKQKELNVYFRSALEAILLHLDNTGKFDIEFNEK